MTLSHFRYNINILRTKMRILINAFFAAFALLLFESTRSIHLPFSKVLPKPDNQLNFETIVQIIGDNGVQRSSEQISDDGTEDEYENMDKRQARTRKNFLFKSFRASTKSRLVADEKISKSSEVRKLNPLQACLCGAFATVVGDFAMHPIDTIKVTQQAAG